MQSIRQPRRATFRWALAGAIGVAAGWFITEAAPARAAVPDVLVTIKPVHAIVAAIMEGAGTPHLLLDGAASPHTYAMRPSDVRRLGGAGIVVRVSAQFELFLARPLAQVKPKALVTLDEIAGMTLHRLRGGGEFEPHVHEAKGASASHDGHSHGDGHDDSHAKGHGKATRGVDGHLWLDPRNARTAALHIAEVLAAIEPAEADRFRRNGQSLAARLEQLDAKLENELKQVAGRPFLVFHDAYQYLEQRYDLAVAGAVTVNADVPPSALRLSQLRSRLAKARAVCVFAEPQFPPRTIETIIEGTSARRGTLDPLGAALPAGPGQYFELMEGLARDLRSCLLGH